MARMPYNDPIDLVLSRLPDASKTSRGWRGKCPVHQDERSKKQSLSIWENPDGSVWFRCYAGCDNESIVRELKLSFSDCYPRSSYIETSRYSSHPTRQTHIAKEQIRPAVTLLMVYAGALAEQWEEVAPILGLDERDKHIFFGVSADLREVLDD